MLNSLQKPTKIRSKKITQGARGRHCTLRTPLCNGNRETVVFCHAPSTGKGMGTKSDDFWGAFGCSDCHDFVDKRRGIDGMNQYWMKGIYETQKILFNEKLLRTG